VIKVVIADNHVIFRQGLVQLLQSEEDISIAGEAGDGYETLNLVTDKKPDILILDITMPGLDGFEVYEKIKSQGIETKVIFLTMHKDPLIAKRAVQSNAAGYVLKDNAFEDLLYAIRAVYSGGTFISPSISDKILKESPLKEQAYQTLTVREREILRLIASGLTNKQVAKKLFISVKTVETHRTNIMQKLDIHITADLVRYAIKIGLLEK
jgi:DNA-binding NarL/FixJ family response regulator